MVATNVDSAVIERLTALDLQQNVKTDELIRAAGAMINNDSDVALTQDDLDNMSNEELVNNGYIYDGEGRNRKEANIGGTGGIALKEFQNNRDNNLVSNLAGSMAHVHQMIKIASQKFQ
jgi:hypothetical protein